MYVSVPSHKLNVMQDQLLLTWKKHLKSIFFLCDCCTNVKEPRQFYYLFIAGVRITEFIPFSTALKLCKMHLTVYIYIYIYICICMCVYIFIYMCVYVSVCVYIYVCVCIYICVCICMCMYVYI